MFILYDKDMNKLDFPSGVKPLDIFISSIQKERTTQTLEGVHGVIDFGSEYRDREIRLKLLLMSADTQDYRLQRDETYALLDDVAYISEKYQAGKRYSVRIDDSYIPERFDNNQTFATAEVNCTTVNFPFAESVKTTQHIENNGLQFGQVWFYGMGLLYDESTHKYTHNTLDFDIYNAGNVQIEPFHQDFTITVKNATKGYTLENKTTGDKFVYTGNTTGTIEIKGGIVTINKLQVFRETNRKILTLDTNNNRFRQNQNKEVIFDFRFYYK